MIVEWQFEKNLEGRGRCLCRFCPDISLKRQAKSETAQDAVFSSADIRTQKPSSSSHCAWFRFKNKVMKNYCSHSLAWDR
jgi:hypothetical protein